MHSIVCTIHSPLYGLKNASQCCIEKVSVAQFLKTYTNLRWWNEKKKTNKSEKKLLHAMQPIQRWTKWDEFFFFKSNNNRNKFSFLNKDWTWFQCNVDISKANIDTIYFDDWDQLKKLRETFFYTRLCRVWFKLNKTEGDPIQCTCIAHRNWQMYLINANQIN